MISDANKNLHFELERSISRRVDSKLIHYQVKRSDNFYYKYTQLWNEEFTTDFVIKHRSFYAYLTKHCVYDVLNQIDKPAIEKQLSELETIADLSDTKEDFNMFFQKKYNLTLPDFTEYLSAKNEYHNLSDFDKKLWIVMHYNPKNKK